MKRKIVIIVSVILVLIMISLYYTYATNVTMEQTSGNADLTYNINLTDNIARSITVEAGKTKYFDIFITNPNDATINYGLAYDKAEDSTVLVAQTDSSLYKAIDTIEKDETRQISLVIKNNKSTSITYNIVPVVGYINGGDLIVPSNHTLIDDVYSHSSGAITGSVYDYVFSGGSTGGNIPEDETGGSDDIDTIVANSPDLVQGLIPVMYSNNKWVKADSTNSNETYKWYDYNNKKWANAVLVSNTNRNTYKNADAGVTISDSDILAYYVWIPRYKYKVWNINKVIGTDSYNVKDTGIDIVFENEKATTGTIKCSNYSFAAPSTSAGSPNETCSGSNGEYYTHPAFTFGTGELRGIWVSKFEISSSSPNSSYGGGNSTSLTVRSKPNVITWRNNYLTNFSYVIQNMLKTNNEYGLQTDSNSHMLKNMEWGAIAYLTHSRYGKCSVEGCEEVALNSYASYMTGCGPQSIGSSDYGNICNEYNSELGQQSSTTGNVYGIYDMSGGAYEYVMGNMSSVAGSYTYNVGEGGSNYNYSTDTAKYLDTYAYVDSGNSGQKSYNTARLGDATGEVVVSQGQSFNDDFLAFVRPTKPWFRRGGYFADKLSAGVFQSYDDTGTIKASYSTRAALVCVQ